MLCEMYLQSAAHITTDPRFIYSFYFQVLFNRSSIPDSSILDPDFPVNLEVLLIKIILFFFFFDHWSDQLFQNNQQFQAIEFFDQPALGKGPYGISILWTWSAASRVRR